MTAVAVAPVVLGCCPVAPRCLLCAPPRPAPDPGAVAALVERHRQAEPPFRVGFYGGPAPSDALLDAIDGVPFVARVRPDLLTRAELDRLAARGAIGIELDALTFGDAALVAVRRHHRAKVVLEQIEGIRDRGLRVGVVLAPGLPGTSHATAVDDAHIAAARVQFVRIHPVLVLDGSGLHRAHLEGCLLYTSPSPRDRTRSRMPSSA